MLIPNQIALAIQKEASPGMVSLDNFQYDAYNTDFGPLTVNDLFILAKEMDKRSQQMTVL